MDLTRERDSLANVRDAADPGYGPLDPQSESGMHERAVFAEIEIPAVGLRIEALLARRGRERATGPPATSAV